MGAYGHRYLIKKVLDHDSSPDVIPVAMNEKHSAEKLEPCYSIITGPHGTLVAFTRQLKTAAEPGKNFDNAQSLQENLALNIHLIM